MQWLDAQPSPSMKWQPETMEGVNVISSWSHVIMLPSTMNMEHIPISDLEQYCVLYNSPFSIYRLMLDHPPLNTIWKGKVMLAYWERTNVLWLDALPCPSTKWEMETMEWENVIYSWNHVIMLHSIMNMELIITLNLESWIRSKILHQI